MRIRRLLMCKPTYFDIDYVINPWMDLANRVDKMKAEDQWANLVATLENLDVQISYIDPQPGLADMTFSGDAGMVRGQKFVVSNFRHPQRQPESHYYEAWMRNHGYETLRIPQGLHFEGLGDILPDARENPPRVARQKPTTHPGPGHCPELPYFCPPELTHPEALLPGS